MDHAQNPSEWVENRVELTRVQITASRGEPGKTGAEWDVEILREGIALIPGLSGVRPRCFPAEVLKRDAHRFEGAPVQFCEIAQGMRDHRKFGDERPDERAGYLRNVRVIRRADGLHAIAAKLVVPSANYQRALRHAWEGQAMPELSIKVVGKEYALPGIYQGRPVDMAASIDEVESVDVVDLGSAGGIFARMAASGGHPVLRDKLLAALQRVAKNVLDGVNVEQVTTGDLRNLLKLAVADRLEATLDAAGKADSTGQRVREVYELRRVREQLEAADQEAALASLEKVLSDAFAPSRSADPPPAAGAGTPSTDPSPPAEEAEGATETPPPAAAGGELSEAEKAALKERAVADANAVTSELEQLRQEREAFAAEREAAKLENSDALVANMVQSVHGLDEHDRNELIEDLQGSVRTRDEVQKRIDRRLRTREAQAEAGAYAPPVRAANRTEMIQSMRTEGERMTLGFAKALGCSRAGAGASEDEWASAPAMGLRKLYQLTTGDGYDAVDPRGRINPARMCQSFREYWTAGESRRAEMSHALTQASFGEVFADATGKTMVEAYRQVPMIGRQISTQQRGINNLYPQKLIRQGGYGIMATRTEGSAYAAVSSPSDEQATLTPVDKGGMETLTWEMVVNDSIGSVAQIAVDLGRAQANTEEQLIADELTNYATAAHNDGTIYTGGATYTVGQLNLGSTALSLDAIKAGVIAMRKQTRSGEGYGGIIVPKFLVVPPDLEFDADEMVNSPGKFGSTDREDNSLRGKLEVLVSHHLRGVTTNWFLVADPMMSGGRGIVRGYLFDREEPELLLQDDPRVGLVFTNRQLRWASSHYVNATTADYRHLYGYIA